MNKTIIALTIGLTIASTSVTAANNTDIDFLFDNANVDMQILDNNEMSETEGQFFGMMMSPMTSMASSMMSPFSSMAGQMMAPMISQMANGAASGATNGVASQLANGTLGQLLGGLLGLFKNTDTSSLGTSLGAGAANLLKSALSGFLSNILKK